MIDKAFIAMSALLPIATLAKTAETPMSMSFKAIFIHRCRQELDSKIYPKTDPYTSVAAI